MQSYSPHDGEQKTFPSSDLSTQLYGPNVVELYPV
jgi:hypothetical protein